MYAKRLPTGGRLSDLVFREERVCNFDEKFPQLRPGAKKTPAGLMRGGRNQMCKNPPEAGPQEPLSGHPSSPPGRSFVVRAHTE